MSKRSERAEAIRVRIIDAAIDCYRENGVQRTSMDLIAEKAGTTKPTVYSHFGSKNALFDAVVASIRSECCKKYFHIYRADISLKEQLTAIFIEYLEDSLKPKNLKLVRALLVELMHRGAQLPAPPDLQSAPSLEGWLKSAMIAGAIPSSDPSVIAENLCAIIKGRFYWPAILGIKTISSTERKQQIEQTIGFFVHALLK